MHSTKTRDSYLAACIKISNIDCFFHGTSSVNVASKSGNEINEDARWCLGSLSLVLKEEQEPLVNLNRHGFRHSTNRNFSDMTPTSCSTPGPKMHQQCWPGLSSKLYLVVRERSILLSRMRTLRYKVRSLRVKIP